MQSIRAKIIALSSILTLAIIGFSTVLMLNYYAAITDSGKMKELSELTRPISALVHELQKERGRSAGYLASGGAAELESKLSAQREVADQRLTQAVTLFADFEPERISTEFEKRIETITARLVALADVREKIDQRDLRVGDMAAWYIETIHQLLGAIKYMGAYAPDGEIRADFIAYSALLEAKERAGLERAMGNVGFSKGAFPQPIHQRFLMLVGQQKAFLLKFRENAKPAQVAMYDQMMTGEAVDQVARMREIAARSPFTGSVEGVTSADWFPQITARINLLKQVEDRLTDDVISLAGVKASEAERSAIVVGSGVLISVLIAAAAAWVVAQSVAGGVSSVSSAVAKLAEGVPVELPGKSRRDEIGVLARSMEQVYTKGLEAARLRAALDGCATMVMVADKDHNIAYCNDRLNALFADHRDAVSSAYPDFDPDALIGASLDLFHARPEETRARIDALTDTHFAKIALGELQIELAISPIRNPEGERIGSVVEWTDKTAELRAGAEIDRVVAAAVNGDFSQRAELAGAPPMWARMGERVNRVADSVAQGLAETSRVMRSLANGELRERMRGDFHGAFADLQDSVNGTIDRLSDLVGEIKATGDAVGRSAETLREGAENLSERAEQQASSLEETSATMEEMSASIRSNADNSESVKALASNATARARSGGEIVDKAVVSMTEIEAGAAKIADIVQVIDGIAFQTNLLALNAAVEAARAGEAGKGFAIVASEVRRLAQNSSEASHDIGALISASTKQVADGARQVKGAGDALNGIVEAIAQVEETITDIVVASVEQASGAGEISSAVNHLDQITQRNAAIADETAATTRSLDDTARRLQKLMAFFKTHEQRGQEAERAA